MEKWVREDFNLDLDDVLTISSLMDRYVKRAGAFEDVYEITGTTREFIQSPVVGGRTMLSLYDKKYTGTQC